MNHCENNHLIAPLFTNIIDLHHQNKAELILYIEKNKELA
uniref:Uncharacterized protein n=1 Tax=uncultured Thiotrichaceae bacterium TaxID=298394 RepID=A0A6S6UKH3_9GAMM|nr:MAG: Unknown protein [uncultured Thiotrichaceae bacterium]